MADHADRSPGPPTSEPEPAEPGARPEGVPTQRRHPTDVEVLLQGSRAIVSGVVEAIAERRRILEAIESLESVSAVENRLRLPLE